MRWDAVSGVVLRCAVLVCRAVELWCAVTRTEVLCRDGEWWCAVACIVLLCRRGLMCSGRDVAVPWCVLASSGDLMT